MRKTVFTCYMKDKKFVKLQAYAMAYMMSSIFCAAMQQRLTVA
jgi:hypothetical protein